MRSMYKSDELFLKVDTYLDVKTYTKALDSNTYAMWEVQLYPSNGATISTEQLRVINDAPDFLRQAPNYLFCNIRGCKVYYEPSVAPNENYPLRNGTYGVYYAVNGPF